MTVRERQPASTLDGDRNFETKEQPQWLTKRFWLVWTICKRCARSLKLFAECQTRKHYDHATNGLSNISFDFPIVADLSILRAIHKKPESGLQACLHVYTEAQIGRSLYLQEDGQALQDTAGDWGSFWSPLEALLIREYEATRKL
jgi:hypothetical protein